MISCISTVDAVQTKDKNKNAKVVQSTSKGWSVKAKVFAALGLAATGLGLYLAWKKLATGDTDLDVLTQYARNEQNAEKYQIPAGRAGRLMHHVLAHHEPCREAMGNAQSQANIEGLFNNEEFMALMNHERFGYICEARINALFNDWIIVQASARPDFIERTLIMLRALTVDREINSVDNRVFND